MLDAFTIKNDMVHVVSSNLISRGRYWPAWSGLRAMKGCKRCYRFIGFIGGKEFQLIMPVWNGRKEVLHPLAICNALKTGKDYSFAANANEIVAMMNPLPWGRKTVDTALVAAVGSDYYGKLQTWGADTRLGNFKLQVRLMPFLMATRNFDSQVLTAIRNLNSSLGISLEKDGIILVAGFEVTTNAADWFWEGRRTAVGVTSPQGSITTVHELTEGIGNSVVSIAVNSPTKQIWDSLRQGQTMLVMLPPDAREPFLAMPFSLAGQAEAIDGFINYMRADAKNLMDSEHFKKAVKK